jgi:hypothetical protein
MTPIENPQPDRCDIDSAPNAEPVPATSDADEAAVAEFHRELQRAIDAVDWTPPFEDTGNITMVSFQGIRHRPARSAQFLGHPVRSLFSTRGRY